MTDVKKDIGAATIKTNDDKSSQSLGHEHLREFQDYLLAYRLRALVSGPARPKIGYLSLSEYARKRLEREALARKVLQQADYHSMMRNVDALTDEINFGFWHNPSETVDFLRITINQGGCSALESPENFIQELLTTKERSALKAEEQQQIAEYYLGLLKASSAYLDPIVFTRLRDEIDLVGENLPIFIVDTHSVEFDLSNT